MHFETKRRQPHRPFWITSCSKNRTKRPLKRKSRDGSLRRFASMRSSGDWPRRELNGRQSIISSVEPLEPAPTLSLIPLDGVSTHGLNRTGTKPPNGPAIFGVLALWTTSSWPLTWSAHGAWLWPNNRPTRMFTSVHPPHMCWKCTTIRLTMIHTIS